jgi:hypothetical protein
MIKGILIAGRMRMITRYSYLIGCRSPNHPPRTLKTKYMIEKVIRLRFNYYPESTDGQFGENYQEREVGKHSA